MGRYKQLLSVHVLEVTVVALLFFLVADCHPHNGYWDIIWNNTGPRTTRAKTWNASQSNEPPLNIDKRFHYMAVSDERQRVMPTEMDRKKGQVLDYKEAILLADPTNPDLKGEVDDKYFYASDNKDGKVYGWVSSTNPPFGFWMINPSNEYRTGGPFRQDLTTHIYVSTHYAGEDLAIKFGQGEQWKKVIGPVFVYLNSNAAAKANPSILWKDAKKRMNQEAASWPYEFPVSKDYIKSNQRGTVSGKLFVNDMFISKHIVPASNAYIGLAPLGEAGSWQRENKGYQFWTKTHGNGNFIIEKVIFVPRILGDYKYTSIVNVTPGSNIKLGVLLYNPPRNGATIWEIGVPDRTAAEFFIPNPPPQFKVHKYKNNSESRFKQYGLWKQYSVLYPKIDLVYNVETSKYSRDWFYAHVTRKIGNNTYKATTWKIIFNLANVSNASNYTLQLALAAASQAELQNRGKNMQLSLLYVVEFTMVAFTFMLVVDGRRLIETPIVRLDIQTNQVTMSNGIVNVTLSIPYGLVTTISYGGVNNLLATQNVEKNRGYWDIFWNRTTSKRARKKFLGNSFEVIMDTENQAEISFKSTWNASQSDELPLNSDLRFVMLRDTPGFYTYAIVERLEGWPLVYIENLRVVFKLQQDMFHYMAISDERQRIMPMPVDRETGKVLDYKEAILLTNPTNLDLKGEVDDKYFYVTDNKDDRVHGWVSSTNPPVGFWMIIPNDEFRTGGPYKQDLTSHVGSTVLSIFVSRHFAGDDLVIKFQQGEPWKKVIGPVFLYLNSNSSAMDNPTILWDDAKRRMNQEVANWPYDFPVSEEYIKSNQRGIIRGQLLVNDITTTLIPASNGYIGLAPPGDVGSWQRENKGYQFWTKTDAMGNFTIENVISGTYNLYATVPGIIGDYKYTFDVQVTPGSSIELGSLVYNPPRNGATLWEIGVPDRTAAEFFVPTPPLEFNVHVYQNNFESIFRQYGLWKQYSVLYPENDLVYNVGTSIYSKDWFFAHVTRNIGNKTYISTTWKIIFNLEIVDNASNYTLQMALAAAQRAELQVRFNDEKVVEPHFTTGKIGGDNAIARHGIHGLYFLYSIEVKGNLLVNGTTQFFLHKQ
ncbi:hypothetical protein KY289_009394 [Solanum tuberosum]|nr:hypothetical protein KY289_009394 [Solanum tuberosum]